MISTCNLPKDFASKEGFRQFAEFHGINNFPCAKTVANEVQFLANDILAQQKLYVQQMKKCCVLPMFVCMVGKLITIKG